MRGADSIGRRVSNRLITLLSKIGRQPLVLRSSGGRLIQAPWMECRAFSVSRLARAVSLPTAMAAKAARAAISWCFIARMPAAPKPINKGVMPSLHTNKRERDPHITARRVTLGAMLGQFGQEPTGESVLRGNGRGTANPVTQPVDGTTPVQG